jgi:hypothetical protein
MTQKNKTGIKVKEVIEFQHSFMLNNGRQILCGCQALMYGYVLANPTQWFFLGRHSRAYRGRAVHQSKIRQLQSAPD